jgi:rhodanese-related sulfurtransferase
MRARERWARRPGHNPGMPGTDGGRRTLDDLLAAAEARISRYSAGEAYEAMRAGALLIDVRSGENRERDGIVPGSLHVPRTVLEWRLDPDSPWRSPHAGGLDRQIVLMCDHGYSTVLAAATLVDLGFTRAGDVVGGFQAWREAGLPPAPAPLRPPGAAGPAGMAGPD